MKRSAVTRVQHSHSQTSQTHQHFISHTLQQGNFYTFFILTPATVGELKLHIPQDNEHKGTKPSMFHRASGYDVSISLHDVSA